MTIVNRIKGFVRSISGALPLTLTDCVDEYSLIDYTISGNCVQNGTPSPDNPVEVESVGDLVTDETDVNYGKYKIPVVRRGKNIVGEYIYTNQTTQYWGVITAKKDFTLKQGVTYTISFDTPNTNMLVYYAHYTNVTEGFKATRLDGKRKFITITPTKDITTNGIISVSSAMSDGIGTGICSNCMIEEGTTATDYEPYAEPVTTNIYLDEPLRKIGDYADYIDFENQKVVRKVSETILNGTEGGTFIGGGTTYERIYYTHSVFGSLPGESLCNAIKTTNSSDSGWNGTGFIIQVSTNGCFIYRPAYSGVLSDITSLNAWNDFLAERYKNGNPIKLYYILAEAIEKIISIPKLPTIKGTTIYSIDTTIQPSDMSAAYYSTVKE